MKSPSNNAPDALSRAPQDVYTWAHAGGRLDGLDELMASACVPIPAEAATRTRMLRVWEKDGE